MEDQRLRTFRTERLIEFFEGDDKRLSMTRLLCFLSFFPSSYVVVTTKDENILAWYLTSFVLGYVGGKGIDAIKNVQSRKFESVENVASIASASPTQK